METEFGLNVKVEGVGSNLYTKPSTNRHALKVKAGRLFHKDLVKSVCVFDEFGQSHLYLRKNPDGTVTREELP